MTRRYGRGPEFPHEEFVQAAIERHFEAEGYTLDVSSHVDLLCSHTLNNIAWHIEAKGMTAAVGLDFRTCLGQLLQRMRDPNVRHAIAVPDTPQHRAQASQISPWVLGRLNIFWLFVSASGAVEIVGPLDAQSTPCT